MYIYIYTSQKVPYLQCFTKSNKLFSPSHPVNHFQNTQYTTIENPDQYSVRFIAGVSSGVFMLVDSIKPAEWDMDQKSHSYNCTLSVTAWSRFQSMQCRCCFGVLFSHRCSLQWIKHCDINVCEGLFCCKLKRVVHVFGTVFEQIIIKRVTWNKSDIVGFFFCVYLVSLERSHFLAKINVSVEEQWLSQDFTLFSFIAQRVPHWRYRKHPVTYSLVMLGI